MEDIIITKEYAQQILEMEDICYSEGQGPNNTKMLSRIILKYPEIAEPYSYLFEDRLKGV